MEEVAATSTTASPSAAEPDVRFDADRTLVYLDPPGRRLLYHVIAIVALATYAVYLGYRAAFTINQQVLVFSLAVYLAEVHGFFSLFFYFHQLWDLRTRTVPAPPPGLSVDAYITTYNEDVELLRQTVRGAVAMRYPHRTYILDDGRRPEVKALAEELGCGYITRANNTHAKAGNWNNAFSKTSGEIIATFDADHVPRANFLERTIGFFLDPRVALVQVPQQYHNVDSVQHRANWKTRRLYGEQDVFFNLVMPGKDHWNAVFFCGTGAVLRRSALAARGGLEVGTITEDLHTAMVLHSEGWKSVYLNELLVSGLAPMDLRSFEAQRLRWAEGNLRTMAFINPLTARGLSLGQRLCYLASLYHWTIGIPKLVFYLAPPIMLLTGRYPIANFDGHFLAVYAVFLATLVGSYAVLSRGTGRLFMDELFNMANVFTLIRAVKRAVFGHGRPSVFVVTSKRGSSAGSMGRILPQCALLAFSVIGLVWSGLGLAAGVSDDLFGTGVCAFWALYNIGLMAGVINLALTPQENRQSYRFRASFPVEVRLPETLSAGARPVPPMLCLTRDVSSGGCTLLSPFPLEPSSRIGMRVLLGLEALECTGEVLSARGRHAGWFVHGVRFRDLAQADVDLLNDAVFNIAVPELFVHLSEPSLPRRLARLAVRWVQRRLFSRRTRRVAGLPVRVAVGGRQSVVVTRDISATGARFTSAVAFEPDEILTFEVDVPAGRWTGQANVVRATRRDSASERFGTWMIGVKFQHPIDGPLAGWIRKGKVPR